MNRAFSVINIKKIDEDKRIIEGIATTPAPDRMGDIVEPLGAKFKLPMPLLWQHDSRKPIGQVTWAKATKSGIKFRAKVASLEAPGPLKDRLDEAWQSVKLSLVRAVSIGFKTLEASIMRETGGIHFLEWEWFELSLVTLPANEEATIDRIKAAFGNVEGVTKLPGVSGKSTDMARSKKAMAIRNFTDEIAALREEIGPKDERMRELMEKAYAESRELDDDEATEYDDLADEMKSLKIKLARLEALENSAATAKRIQANTPKQASASRSAILLPAEAKKTVEEHEKGLGFARLVSAWLYARQLNDAGSPTSVSSVLKARYPNLPRDEIDEMQTICSVITKAQIDGATTTDSTWASPLVTPTNLLSEFVSYLRPRTIVGRFGVGNIPSLRRIPFNVRFPAQTSGGEGYWVGEGRAKPLTRFDFSSTTLGYFKVANIAVLSEELVRLSSPSAEMAVRDALAEALQSRMDQDFVDPTVTLTAGVRPASITNGAATAVTTGVDAAAVRTDLNTLFGYFVANYISTGSVVIIMRTAQALRLSLMRNALGQKEFPDMTMNGGFLEGFPVIASQYVPSGVVIAAAADEVYFSDDGGVSIALSREASLEMDSTPSSKINDGSSPPVSVEATMVSMFQTNSVAVRAERWLNWQRRRDYAVAYLTGVGWGGEDTSPITAI